MTEINKAMNIIHDFHLKFGFKSIKDQYFCMIKFDGHFERMQNAFINLQKFIETND